MLGWNRAPGENNKYEQVSRYFDELCFTQNDHPEGGRFVHLVNDEKLFDDKDRNGRFAQHRIADRTDHTTNRAKTT